MNSNENTINAVLLRTLSRKSVLWFGKFEGLSVQQIIDMKRGQYLRWLYYNCQGVSFLNDVLEEIRINEYWRIKKPGIRPKKHDQLCQENRKKMSFKSKSHVDRVMRIRKHVKKIKTEKKEVTSRGVSQACNLQRIKHK